MRLVGLEGASADSLLDFSTDGAKKLAEGRAVLFARGQVFGEPCLFSEADTEVHACSLVSLGVSDCARHLGDLSCAGEGKEHHPVGVGEHEVIAGHQMCTDVC